MIEGVEDTFRWTWTKNGLFSSKSMYRVLGAKNSHLFSLEVHLEELCAVKVVFICLGGFLGKDLNL